MLSKLEEAVADEPVAPVGEKNGVAASKMEAAAVGAAAPAKTAADSSIHQLNDRRNPEECIMRLLKSDSDQVPC